MRNTLGTPDIDGRIILKGSLRTMYWANSDSVLEGAIVITKNGKRGVSYKTRNLLKN
jgi:hypothetical protein